ncbi:hypothetical protein K7X08_033905 [Anisodus acutangulus]|uniref:Uncharacterized protein n=1 Tax=Anisodus acutangulus TaxID=402998 RepID=A0A9Q1M2Y9_9SOLA|nr:hypothetical protein K7X08_033905 [Anisodus acutangulus]
MEAMKKQNRVFEDGKSGASEEMKTLEGEASALRGKIRQLESELEEKAKEASSAEANAGLMMSCSPAISVAILLIPSRLSSSKAGKESVRIQSSESMSFYSYDIVFIS